MLHEPVQEVRVYAPATVANVACGYDVLGFSIAEPGDEIVVRHSEKPGLHITISMGIAAFPEHGANFSEVFVCADRALFDAKHSGKDRVTLYIGVTAS